MKPAFFFIACFALIGMIYGYDPQVICNLPMETGICRANQPKYYYDSATKSCVLFTYGGCQGNENNFPTKAACLEKCDGI